MELEQQSTTRGRKIQNQTPCNKFQSRLEVLDNLYKDLLITPEQYRDCFNKNKQNLYKDYTEHYSNELREYLLSPKASTEKNETPDQLEVPHLQPEEIQQILLDNVHGVEDMLDRTGSVPVSTFIKSTYENGLPLFEANPAVQQHTVKAMRVIFHKGVKMHEKGRKQIFKRLAEAYTACQMEQGRVIDSIYGSLTGRDKSFKEQILTLVDMQKEQVLNQLVNLKNPDAWRTSDDYPEQQVPHIQSSYCVAIGPNLGLRGIKSSQLDNFCVPLDPRLARELETMFKKLFSLNDLVNTIVSDINQQEVEAERLIGREALAKWASEVGESSNGRIPGFDSHGIFFDEEKSHEYDGVPKEENKYQIYINRKVALEILIHLFFGMIEWEREKKSGKFGEKREVVQV